jgi:hypothetical protein
MVDRSRTLAPSRVVLLPRCCTPSRTVVRLPSRDVVPSRKLRLLSRVLTPPRPNLRAAGP